jgi:hypothetical protein
MSTFEIIPSKLLTITCLTHGTFLPIKATYNKPKPFVTFGTVGYIRALLIDTVTVLHSNPPQARALRNKKMVCELEKLTPADFSTELLDCLVYY